ncbi:MAG: rod shape-determining protein [Clostridiales Family XIII bacterium]|nr:rod shape-determining protein [Clostridiales Family XIII bacterium]
MMAFGNKDIGIDLGTANTLVYITGKGIILNEPSVIAVDKLRKRVLAVGSKAKEMIGKAPTFISVVRPLEEGVIFDFEMTEIMLKYFIRRAVANISPFSKIRIAIGVPSGVTEVEKRAVEEVARGIGAKEVYILDEPMAAAIGVGVPIELPDACMICDIGGGTSDVAVLALDGVVSTTSIRHAGNNLNEAILNFIRKKYNLLIGDRMAEEIKINAGTAFLDEEELLNPKKTETRGRDIVTGLPKSIQISSNDLFNALEDSVSIIIETIKETLEKTPPEMAADIQKNGIILTGGGSLLRGFDKLVERETGLNVIIPENAKEAVAKGLGKALKSIDKLKVYSSNNRKRV